MFDEFFTKASELVQQGKPFVVATVVRAAKPTSAKPGDKAIVSTDGSFYGWIGGSCAQPTVITEALKALAASESRLIRLSTEPGTAGPRQGIIDLPMTCFSGGTLEIFLEPHHPRSRLIIIGNLPVAQALSQLAKAMNYQVITVELDHTQGQRIYADEVLENLEALKDAIRPHTYIVVATHGNYDEMALEKILPLEPTYVGLVASPKRAEAVRDYLLGQGISENELLPLKSPAGLDIQARHGDEIALSIMAEIVQKHRNAEELDLALLRESMNVSSDEVEGEKQDSGIAVDPICHMEVDIATAAYFSDYEGDRYYFCCAGCKATFEKDPDRYTVASTPSGSVSFTDIHIDSH